MRDIAGKELLREMIEEDETIVQTETVKVTYAELRKLVRSTLSEDIAVANEEMDAPDELVVQEDPLYPGDDGLELPHTAAAPEAPGMAPGVSPSPCSMAASLPAAVSPVGAPGSGPDSPDDMVTMGGPDELDAVLAMIGGEPSEAEMAPSAHLPKRAAPDFWDQLDF